MSGLVDHDGIPTDHPAPRLGGHVVLDLLNTRELASDGWRDWLDGPRKVDRWLRDGGLHGEGAGEAAGVVGEIQALRERVRHLVLDRIDGVRGDFAGLNEFLASVGGHWALAWSAEAAMRTFVRHGPAARVALAPLAERAAELIALPDFRAVKRCGNPDCTMLFWDATPTGRRRWCDMGSCGNRRKVAAFRRRHYVTTS